MTALSGTALDQARRLVQNSGWFDLAHYSRLSGRDFADEAAGAEHYLLHGREEGWDPSPGFETGHYLRAHGDVRRSGTNPLLHYLRTGMAQGRRPRREPAELAEGPRAPSRERWLEIAAARGGKAEPPDDEASVDVVVPVYKGVDDTLACIESVLMSRNATPCRLLVIDDLTPEPALAEALRFLASLGLISLVANRENLGFVRSANKGLSASESRDVVLLNADTLVHGDWLDRLRRHAREPDVATVTPLSDNAGMFSYPHVRGVNDHRLEVGPAELDALFAEVNAGCSVETPTGVGFCFYVTRRAIRGVGVFDVGFSPGYGEENDFCARAVEAGWRNLAALNVFVRHTGGVSFSLAAERAKARAGERLAQKHPGYADAVETFIEADPLKAARARVDLARARRLGGGRGVLMIEHGWGGGIGRHIDDLAERLAAEGIQTFRAAPVSDGSFLRISVRSGRDFPNLPDLDPIDEPATAEVLRSLGVDRVHIHSLVACPLAWFGPLRRAIASAGLQYEVTSHDYSPVCPRLNMVDWGGVYCANRSEAHCRVCIREGDLRVGQVDIAEWRGAHRDMLGGARQVFAPDPDAAARLRRYLPELQPRVRPHPPIGGVSAGPAPTPRAERRVVGVVGAIGPGKGSGLLVRLAGDALQRDLPLDFRIFGYTNRPELIGFPNVEVTGRYAEDELDDRLRGSPPDLLFYPAVAPETFCYALDAAFRTRLLPVCFDLGAVARRIREAAFGTVLPLHLIDDPAAVNDALLKLDIDTSAWREDRVFPPERRWVSARAYYGAPSPGSPTDAG